MANVQPLRGLGACRGAFGQAVAIAQYRRPGLTVACSDNLGHNRIIAAVHDDHAVAKGERRPEPTKHDAILVDRDNLALLLG